MIAAGVSPDKHTFNVLINCCAKKGDLPNGVKIFGKMSKDGISADVIAYNSLINCAAQNGDLNQSVKVYDH